MAKKVKFKQCKMVKKEFGREVHTVSWIPEKFAVVGKVLKLKNKEGEWDDGYVVESASSEAIDEPPDPRQSIRGHRKATGDSLPKERQNEKG